MPKKIGLCCLLSVAALCSPVSWANPNSLALPVTDASVQNAIAPMGEDALNTPIRQLWADREALTASLLANGLIHADDDGHQHDMGQGGNFEPEIGALPSDSLSTVIGNISQQAQRRQDSLDQLSESLSGRPQGGLNVSQFLAVEPVANARVSSSFGYRTMGGRGEFHPGIDLAANYGAPVYATGTGVVIYSGWMRGYGNFIEIDHGNGYKTRYGHSSRLLVSVGDEIKKNQQIAMVGCTGRCTGPHVHYEVLQNGKRQNPAMYLALAPRRED